MKKRRSYLEPYAGKEGIVHTEFSSVVSLLELYLLAERLGTRTVFFYENQPRVFHILYVKDLAQAYQIMANASRALRE
jgi:hypothetical protein